MTFTGINVDPFFTDALGNTQNLCWGIQQDGSDVFAMSSRSDGFSPIGFTKLDTSGSIVTTATLDPLNNSTYYYAGVANKPMFSITASGALIALIVGTRWVAINRSDLSYHTGATVSGSSGFGHRVALSADEAYAASITTATGIDCVFTIFKISGPTAVGNNFNLLSASNQPPASPVDCQFDNSNNFWVMCIDGSLVQYSVDASTLAITKVATYKPYTPGTTGSHKICPRPTAGEFTIWYVDGTVLRWVPGAASIVTGSQFTSTAATASGAYGGAQGIAFVGDRTAPTDKRNFMASLGGTPKIVLTDILNASEQTLAFSLWSGAGLPAPSGITGGGVYDKTNGKIWYSCASFASGLDVLDFALGVGYSQTWVSGNWP